MRNSSKCASAHPVQRRRKQLRVAQQAYRKRKETTISNLQNRVEELESGIEELSQSFLSFSNLLFEADILDRRPNVTSALQKITQQCVALAKQGCEDPEPKAEVDAVVKIDRIRHHTPEINLDFDTEIVQSNGFSFADDPFEPSLTTLAHWTQLPPTPPHQDQSLLPFGIVYSPPPISFSNTTQSSPSPPATVSPSSLMERGLWSLSHRLVRQCCQNGYRLLTNNSNDLSTIQQVFGAPLSTTERNRLITVFHKGMHDEVGDLIEQTTKVLDPLHNRRENLSPEQLARTTRWWQFISDFGPGEYMDASGVQSYLQQKGVRISDGEFAQPGQSINYMTEIDASSFIRCEFLQVRISVQVTKLICRSLLTVYLYWSWSGVQTKGY